MKITLSAIRKADRAHALGWTLRQRFGPCTWMRIRKDDAKHARKAK